MRKIRFKPVAVIAAALAPLLAAAGVITHTAIYNGNNITFGTDTLGGVTYTTVNYDGLYNGGDPGMPSLPIDYLKFSVPYNATNFTVSTVMRTNAAYYINYLVYPCQAPRMINDSTPMTITLPDSSAYYSNTAYPTQRAWVVDEGFLAGENHIVTVAVMPISYCHTSTSDQLALTQRINLTLSYDLSDNTTLRPIVREDTALRQKGYRLTQGMVINPNQVKSNAPTVDIPLDTLEIPGRGDSEPNNRGGFDPHFPPLDSLLVDTTGINTGYQELGNNISYLIITTNELKHSMRRLAALKRQKGYSVRIVTLDEILSDPHASQGDVIKRADGSTYVSYDDDAGKIRQYLKHHYKINGSYYIFLAGNIPYRTIKKPYYNNADSIYIPSDLYYSDLNGDWKNDIIDYGPELYVGRIMASNPIDISNYTEKLFRYQLNPGYGNPDYLDNALLSCSIDLLESGEYSEVKLQLKKIFPNALLILESLHNSNHSPSGEEIIDSINTKHYGFISLHHHGSPSCLITYGVHNWQPYDDYRFLWALDTVHFYSDTSKINDDPSTRNGLNKMDNKWHPIVCYSTACNTMPFDKQSPYEFIPMSFGESFTIGKDYGGPAFIGNTRNGYTPNTGFLEREFLKKLKDGYTNIAIANGLAKYSQILGFDTIAGKATPIIQNLFGDPDLVIWTGIPLNFSGITVTRKNNCITISGISKPTVIAFADNNGQILSRIVQEDTSLYNVSPNSTIMLYNKNHIPYIAPLLLQNVNIKYSQYVIASDVTAGESVDSNRTPGYVTVKSGVEYEIEASGTVTLSDGFSVEKGATFAVYPSSF